MNLDDEIRASMPYAKEAMGRVEAEILHYKLLQWFPHTIKRVALSYDAMRDTRLVAIEFRNGYVVTRPVTEMFSTECHATCIMVHDLPLKNDS
jgi:hypothetical protein